MKKTILVIISIIVLVFLVNAVFALNIKDCKKDCTFNKLNSNYDANDNFKLCKENCTSSKYSKCVANCSKEKILVLKNINSEFSKCNQKCSYINKNITCLNGRYNAGDVFISNCQKCECGYNSRVSCSKTDFCNFDPKIDVNYCLSNNGFFNQLCNGPYFDIVCSKDSYCLCEGSNNYSCPSDYFCLHDFSLSLTRRAYTIPGWKTLLGKNLGDIGICVKKPILESCGNGICDNKIVDSKNPENSINCPEDCK